MANTRAWPPFDAESHGKPLAASLPYGSDGAEIAVHLDVLRQQAETAGYTLIEALDMATAALSILAREAEKHK